MAPNSESIVAIGLLDAELVVVALLDLRAQGHLDISWEEPKDRSFLYAHSGTFGLRFTARRSRRVSTTGGLEAQLLSALGRDTAHLYTLINHWWLGGENLAINGVVVFAQREALSPELLRRLPAGRRFP
jgi:hypothetical protein